MAMTSRLPPHSPSAVGAVALAGIPAAAPTADAGGAASVAVPGPAIEEETVGRCALTSCCTTVWTAWSTAASIPAMVSVGVDGPGGALAVVVNLDGPGSAGEVDADGCPSDVIV